MLKSNALIVLAIIAGMTVLSILGSWQVKRLHWKEQLISQTKARASQEPQVLEAIEKLWKETSDVDYYTIKISGTYDHTREMYYFNTWKGRSGWNVITPLKIKDERIILVNRGFVPFTMRDKSTRLKGQVEGMVAIQGLARNPIDEKPNSLMPDNQLDEREFFWKSQIQMASLASANKQQIVLPFTVDAGPNTGPVAYPRGGTTRMEFPNSHLQYALTWYGLALSLFGVGAFFLYSRRKSEA